MAGHSKWANRKHRKERQDAKRGKIFSRMAREIMVAAKAGGGDPETNSRLRLAIERAREERVPAENIERAIQRGAGGGEGANLEELVYEGYGPGGVAVLVEIMTDNRNRTAAEIRHIFTKNGGSLGESGCVAWMFERRGLILIDRRESGLDEETVMLMALEAGAEDIKTEEETYEIIAAPESFEAVKKSLEAHGAPLSAAELTMLPKSEVRVVGKAAEQLLKLLDVLEDHDDVQAVHANGDLDEADLARLEV